MAKKPLAYTGLDLDDIGPIGSGKPASGAFTTVSASGAVSAASVASSGAITGTSIATTGGAGFHGESVQAQISGLDADLTNSVTSGGTDNTIADYSDLSTYATDAAAIRNNIYQLARSVKVIQDGLRDLGLFS